MQFCFITFLSQTQAMRLKGAAKKAGIGIEIVQTPKDISYGGCSYAARCRKKDLSALLSLCRKQGISFSRIFQEMTDMNGRKFYEKVSG